MTINTGLALAFFLVLLGFVWGFWMIFRSKDGVTQPIKVLTYFIGAVLAVFMAILVTVKVFPGFALWFLNLAKASDEVQQLQQQADEIFQEAPAPSAPTRVVIGPTAPVSPVAVPGGAGTLATTPVPGQQRYHVVKLGETLYSIGRTYGVSTQSIQNANGISNPNDIKAGQRLVIPTP